MYIHQSTSEIDGEVESLEDGLIQSSDFQTLLRDSYVFSYDLGEHWGGG